MALYKFFKGDAEAPASRPAGGDERWDSQSLSSRTYPGESTHPRIRLQGRSGWKLGADLPNHSG